MLANSERVDSQLSTRRGVVKESLLCSFVESDAIDAVHGYKKGT